jgi:hypothetical protein
VLEIQPPSAKATEDTPPEAETTGADEDLVICADIVDGAPVGVAHTFGPTQKVCAFWRFERLPNPSTGTAVWSYAGNEVVRTERQVGAAGWASFILTDNSPAGLRAGDYALALLVNGVPQETKTFTIQAGQHPNTGDGDQPTASTQAGEPNVKAVFNAIKFRRGGLVMSEYGYLLKFDGTHFHFRTDRGQQLLIAKSDTFMVYVVRSGKQFYGHLRSDTLILTDGKGIIGQLVSFDGKQFTMSVDGAESSYPREQVQSLYIQDVQ